MNNYTAAVLGIGAINPRNGNTKYDWNVFSDKNTSLFVCGNSGRLLYATPGSFEVGDTVELRNNDTGRKLQDVTIEKECKNQIELMDYLALKGYQMTTPRAFQKRKGMAYKPNESYSVKGYDFK